MEITEERFAGDLSYELYEYPLTVYCTRQADLLFFNIRAPYYSGDQIKDRGVVCSVFGRLGEKCHAGFWLGRYHLEDQAWESLDWISLA